MNMDPKHCRMVANVAEPVGIGSRLLKGQCHEICTSNLFLTKKISAKSKPLAKILQQINTGP